MAGIYDYPGALPADRISALAKVLAFLATGTEALEDIAARGRGGELCANDYAGLGILLRACAETLEDIEKRQ